MGGLIVELIYCKLLIADGVICTKSQKSLVCTLILVCGEKLLVEPPYNRMNCSPTKYTDNEEEVAVSNTWKSSEADDHVHILD